MICALCLYERLADPFQGPLFPVEAVTIANGHALCGPHFKSVARKINDAGGPVALSHLADHRFDGPRNLTTDRTDS